MKTLWLGLIGLLLIQPVYAEVVDIDIDRFKALMADGIVVIDVRTPQEWRQTGIIENSIPIMFFDEKRRPHVEQWLLQASKYSSPDNELILICRSGNRSKTIATFISKHYGYNNVYNVAGGIRQWLLKGNQTVTLN